MNARLLALASQDSRTLPYVAARLQRSYGNASVARLARSLKVARPVLARRLIDTGPGRHSIATSSDGVTEAALTNYDIDGHELKEAHKDFLDRDVVPLLTGGHANVWLRGSASRSGSDEHNRDLSRLRVEAVAQYLIDHGVAPERVQGAVAYGETFASVAGEGEQDRAVFISIDPGIVPEPPPPGRPPPPVDDDETIDLAIRLFESAQASRTQDGRRIVLELRSLRAEDEIGYVRIGRTYAQAREGIGGWGRYDIAVSTRFRRDVIGTSLRLVHEALHHLYDEPYIDEELISRNAQVDFYVELRTGLLLNGYLHQAAVDEDLEGQRAMRDQDRLIDDIVARDYPFDAQWVREHILDWGGIPNRMLETKTRYLAELLEDPASYGDIVIDILESEEASPANLQDIVSGSGGPEQLGSKLHILLYGHQNFVRLTQLQANTGVNLGVPSLAP